MKKMAIVIVITALSMLLGACATTEEAYTADGSLVYVLDCYAQTSDACLQKAGDLCGSLGYRFVTLDGKPLPPPAAVATTAQAPATAPAPATPMISISDYESVPLNSMSAPQTKSPTPAAPATPTPPVDPGAGAPNLFASLKTVKPERRMYLKCGS
jgi:hypothetical protein